MCQKIVRVINLSVNATHLYYQKLNNLPNSLAEKNDIDDISNWITKAIQHYSISTEKKEI